MTQNIENMIVFAEEILHETNTLNNVYFKQLRNKQMSFEVFQKTQIQMYFAVVFFPQPMSVLMARISDPKVRLNILHNIIDEHGGVNLSEKGFHASTFKNFLASIGQKEFDASKVVVLPQVVAFNQALMGVCSFSEIEMGIACYGMIEHVFSQVSDLIGRSVIDYHWVAEPDLTHYQAHKTIDVLHAKDFFELVEAHWMNEEKQVLIKQGIRLGSYIFDRLYCDLAGLKMRAC